MARFSDFFPSTGGVTTNNPSTTVTAGSYDLAGLTNSALATFTPNTPSTRNASIMVGDSVSFQVSSTMYTGTVTMLPSGAQTIIVMLAGPVTIAAQTGISVNFSSGGGTVINNNVMVGGQVNASNGIVGDIFAADGTSQILENGTNGTDATFTGNVTGNVSGSAATLLNNRAFSITGDVTAAAIQFNGGADVTLSASLAGDSVGNAEIADDAVGPEHIAASVAGNGLSQATGGALDVNIGTGANSGGLEISSDVVRVKTGTGLSFDSVTGALNVASVASSNTHFFASANTFTSEAAALAAFVAAFNAATASAAGTSGGFTVPAAQTLEQGDSILIQYDESGSTVTENYVYFGATVTAPTNVVATNFADLTHTGDVVEQVAATAGNSGITVSGSATRPTIAVDPGTNIQLNSTGVALATNVDVAGTLDVTSAAVLDSTLTVAGQATFSGLVDINAGVDIDTGGNAVDINAGAGAIMLAGSAITRPGSGSTALAINSSGQVITATTTSTPIVSTTVFAAAASGGAVLRSAGNTTPSGQASAGSAVSGLNSSDVIILQPFGAAAVAAANRTLEIDGTPAAGTFYDIANLGDTVGGSGGQFWNLDAASGNLTVMGQALTGAFELNDTSASFRFFYTGTPSGWVIIGAN